MLEMQSYKYCGIDQQGNRCRGRMSAESEAVLEQRLQVEGIQLIQVKPIRRQRCRCFRSALTHQDKLTLLLQIKQLLAAGLPLTDVISEVAGTADKAVIRQLFADIHHHLLSGADLSTAISSYPQHFDTVFVEMFRVAERTSELDKVLAQLIEMQRWQQDIQHRAWKLISYPLLLLAVLTCVVIFMMLLVVPEMTRFIQDMGGQLQGATRSLILLSELLLQYGLQLLVSLLILVMGVVLLLRNSFIFRLYLHRFLLRMPVVGRLIKNIQLARLSKNIATMYSAGVPLPEVFTTVIGLTNNLALKQALQQAQQLVVEGMPIYLSFQTTGLFPAVFIRLLKVGEQSGKLDLAMMHCNGLLDNEVRRYIDRLEPLLEPLLTLVMAVVVGWIMLAVLGPVYDIIAHL